MVKGKWYRVRWADVASHDASDPELANLVGCTQHLRFLEKRRSRIDGKSIPVVVFTLSEYDDSSVQDGWIAIPEVLILSTEKV